MTVRIFYNRILMSGLYPNRINISVPLERFLPLKKNIYKNYESKFYISSSVALNTGRIDYESSYMSYMSVDHALRNILELTDSKYYKDEIKSLENKTEVFLHSFVGAEYQLSVPDNKNYGV